MRLSDLQKLTSIHIVRDGEFSSLATFSRVHPDALVHVCDAKFLSALQEDQSFACVVTSPELGTFIPPTRGLALDADPRTAFYAIHKYLLEETSFYWTEFPSEVSPDSNIHPRAYVAPRNVRIGRGTVIEANAVIHERTIIGEHVRVGAGAVIGGEGFEPRDVSGEYVIIPHAGGVRLGDRVEVQANSHIAKALFGGFTEVGEGSKISALVHIAHDVRIGRRCSIACGTMISGSTDLGDAVRVAPNATISSNLRIGSRAWVTLGAVVTRDVQDGQHVSGNFAIDHGRFLSFLKSIR